MRGVFDILEALALNQNCMAKGNNRQQKEKKKPKKEKQK